MLGMPGLLYALSIANMLSGRATLPILHHCVIESPIAGSEILVPSLKYTDLDLWVTIPLVGTEGSLETPVALPMKRFYQVCNQLDKGLEVELRPRLENKPGARIDQTDAEGDPLFRLDFFGLPAEEFPELPQFEPISSVTFTGVSLTAALKTVHGALSNDETRVILTGTLMEITGGRLPQARFIATDTHRLHLTGVVVVEKSTDSDSIPFQTVLTSSLVKMLLRIVRDNDLVRIEFSKTLDMVRVTITQEKTLEGVREIQIYGRTIEGTFPNYQRVIPSGLTESVTVPRKQLVAGVKRMALVALDNAKRVVLEPAGDRLYLKAESGTTGNSEAIIKGAKTTPDMVGQWAQNCHYLLTVLDNIADEQVTIMGHEPLRPFVVYGGQPKTGDQWRDGTHFICMPMQVI